jgi:hypothetical protein
VSRIDPLFVSLVSLGHPRILFVVVFRHVSLPKSQNLIYSVWRCKNGTNLFSTQLFLCFNSPLFLVRRSPLQMQSWGSHLCPFVFCKSRLTNSIVQPFYVASRFRYVIRWNHSPSSVRQDPSGNNVTKYKLKLKWTLGGFP